MKTFTGILHFYGFMQIHKEFFIMAAHGGMMIHYLKKFTVPESPLLPHLLILPNSDFLSKTLPTTPGH